VNEADFSKQQTKMAHTIGKEFEKKGVGDEAQGGPYAVASAMVRDKPEAAKKAYKTIQSKMKEEADAELLFNLYNDLNEENQEMFMSQLEEDAEALLEFAQRFLAD
jgi:predicted house-cleaning noncanonical NTP pyrophosphatase (MazG superfamily)